MGEWLRTRSVVEWLAAIGWIFAALFFVLWATGRSQGWWTVAAMGNAGTWAGAVGTTAGVWFAAWSLRSNLESRTREQRRDAALVSVTNGSSSSGGNKKITLVLENRSEHTITSVKLWAEGDEEFPLTDHPSAKSHLVYEEPEVLVGQKMGGSVSAGKVSDWGDGPRGFSVVAEWTDGFGDRWRQDHRGRSPKRATGN